jgi:hypothetical protein
MSDLNEMVLPAVWSLARRVLADGPSPSLDALVDRLTPVGLIRRSGEGAFRSRHVGPSLRTLRQLGILFEGDDGAVTLADPAWDEADFRYAVAVALLTVPEDDDPWEIREPTTRLEHHLEVAVAWTQLIGLNSRIENWQTAAEVLDRQFGIDRPLLRDTAPFNALERVAMWLGVTAVVGGRMLPDPTALVRSGLDTLMPEPSCLAAEVLRRSAEQFPWLPHGRIGRAVAEHMRNVPDGGAADGRFPEGLSLALIRLEQEKAIMLDPGDDPKTRVLLSFGGVPERGVARVVRT